MKLSHDAATTNCKMNLNLYLPPASTSSKVPVLFYLAGLTCTGDNGAEKGFFQARASQKGIAMVYPDTSPRGLSLEGEDDSYDFGSGAGFYVDATATPWSKGYKMYSYLTDELPKSLFEHFKELDGDRVSITGHSMGGHGALTLVSTRVKLRGQVTDAVTVPQESWQVQVSLRVRPNLQSAQGTMGREGVQGLLWRGSVGSKGQRT